MQVTVKLRHSFSLTLAVNRCRTQTSVTRKLKFRRDQRKTKQLSDAFAGGCVGGWGVWGGERCAMFQKKGGTASDSWRTLREMRLLCLAELEHWWRNDGNEIFLTKKPVERMVAQALLAAFNWHFTAFSLPFNTCRPWRRCIRKASSV